jgi:hypothetical protein
MAKGTRTWSKGKLLKFSVVAVLIFLLLAEGIARVLFYVKYRGLGTSVYVQGSPLQEPDSVSVYNNRAYYVDFDMGFQYNELGMRSRCGDYAMPVKKPGECWVLLLGASAMEGMGSNKEGAWLDITGVSDHPYNGTIAFYLEELLRERFPERSFRVFNAAVSGFTLEQEIAKYRELARRYAFDWVISMDGVNECDTLDSGTAAAQRAFSRKYWESFPFHKFPLSWIVPVTRHSAFFNLLKQEVYRIRMNVRTGRNARKGFPARRYWAGQAGVPLRFAPDDRRVSRSVGAFLREERAFAEELGVTGKNYLLLIQPFLAFRDSAKMAAPEIALDRYLRAEMNDPYKQAFLRAVYADVDSASDPHIQTMGGVSKWSGWTFVDYCHFTDSANRHIARELAGDIAAGGKLRIFK